MRTYVEAVNYLQKAYPTDSNIANATSKIASLSKVSNETLVQFADVLSTRVL